MNACMSMSINFYKAKSQYLISYFSNTNIAFLKKNLSDNISIFDFRFSYTFFGSF